MYFSPEPKYRREDLFDREKELNELDRIFNVGSKIVLVTGIRRIGKTSLVSVYLNERKKTFALADLRGSSNSFQALYEMFSEIINQIDKKEMIRTLLSKISGVQIGEFGISLSWKRGQRVELVKLIDAIDEIGKEVMIAIDEAQKLRGALSNLFLEILAHCYDYCKNVKFVLTGSEAGLLHSLLRINDPESPLYGRFLPELRLFPFSRDESKKFLSEGLKQYKIPFNENLIELAFEYLDGIVGWLNELGLRCVLKGEINEEIIREVFNSAVKLQISEISHYSPNYSLILEAIGKGYNTWSEMKKYISMKFKRTLLDSELFRYINNLKMRDYIYEQDNEYYIGDPILRKYFSSS
ncbi:MAG: AAA family ATPase [Thermoprotei archaeon]